MRNELEKFVKANRDAFDSEEPPARVWDGIQKQFGKPADKKVFAIRSLVVKISSVAAAVLLVSLGIWYALSPAKTITSVAKTTVAVDTAVIKTPALADQPKKDTETVAMATPKDSNNETGKDEYSQEIFYYTKLSEIKMNQLKRISKDEPLLYKSFTGEIKKLDSTYHNLQSLLAGNANKEAVLNAMLTNLKMQTEILNKQLNILHTIKESKKSKYEKYDYPSL